MRSGIDSKKNHVTGLFNAMHSFALVLCMTSVCDLSPKFKESGICIHTLVGQEKGNLSVQIAVLKSKFVAQKLLDRVKGLACIYTLCCLKRY